MEEWENGKERERNETPFPLCFHWGFEDALCRSSETNNNSASQTIFEASKVLKAPLHIFKLSTLISLRALALQSSLLITVKYFPTYIIIWQ